MKAKKSKCRNRKVDFEGIKFDSKLECERYKFLERLQEEGYIHALKVHVPFPIIKKSEFGREIKYVCDFAYVYTATGEAVIEDVKSKYTASMPVYRLKKRLFAEKYGFEIVEVFDKCQPI